MQRATHKTGRKGFTLIELLVVIAIIAILAAILFPVFSRARAKALETVCLSNVKNLAMAMIIYAIDYDGMLPIAGRVANPDFHKPPYYPEGQPSYIAPWYLRMDKYEVDEDILRCPSSKDIVGYGMNLNMSARPLSSIGKLTRTCVVTEIRTSTLKSQFVWGWGAAFSTSFCASGWPYNDIPRRHKGRVNCGFLGGNAKSFDVVTGVNPARPSCGAIGSSWVRWN